MAKAKDYQLNHFNLHQFKGCSVSELHSKNQGVRVRFAPSPTGYLHIGSLRVALFNWLYARHHNGTYLLRVEDTDTERSKPEYTDAIFRSLAWVGITADEDVVIQSEQIAQHRQVVLKLCEQNKAYRCYCTQQEVVDRHQALGGDPNFVRYDGLCRKRDISELSDINTKAYVIRFKIPEACSEVIWDDQIRGQIRFGSDQFDDFIIVRSDGNPIYNLVVVIDDATMGITHVIRGEDHISNTPKQILLYQACGYEIPFFAHLPMILGPEGNRLSKRDAATGADEYRKMGYLPDALINYLARLGWSHGDQELFSREELISFFSLDHVGKKGAIFDKDKLDWLNGLYIRKESEQQLLTSIIQDVDSQVQERLYKWSDQKICAAIALYKDRVKTLGELVSNLVVLHNGPYYSHDHTDHIGHANQIGYDANDLDFCLGIDPNPSSILLALSEALGVNAINTWNLEVITQEIKRVALDKGLKLGSIAALIRVALIGKREGPGLFGMIYHVGQDESVQRLLALHTVIMR